MEIVSNLAVFILLRLLLAGVPGIDKAVQRLEADRACDFGRLWAIDVYRVSSVGFACGFF